MKVTSILREIFVFLQLDLSNEAVDIFSDHLDCHLYSRHYFENENRLNSPVDQAHMTFCTLDPDHHYYYFVKRELKRKMILIYSI